MKKILFLFIFLFLGISSSYGKPLTFKISEDVSYDDNIYLTDNDERDSFIRSTQVMARYKNKIPESSINIDANANLGYNSYSEDSTINNYVNAGVGLKLNNKNFDFRENFIYTSDPANLSLRLRSRRVNNDIYLGYSSNKEKRLGYGLFIQDILDNYIEHIFKYLSRNRINLGFKLFYNFTSKKSAYLGYQYSNISYLENDYSNSNGNSIFLGITGEITPKTKGTVQLSYDDRHYNKNNKDSISNGNVIGYLVNVTYKPYYSTTLSLDGNRKMEESSFGKNRYYISTSVYLTVKQMLFKKFMFRTSVGYENMEYPIAVNNSHRTDDYFTIIPGIDYDFEKYFSVGLWYQYRNKNSNFNYEGYSDNKCGIKVSFSF